MSIIVSAALDAGNIRLLREEGDRLVLEIVADRQSDFYQWFHFRVLGARGRRLTYEIVNAAGAAFPGGWEKYRACWSADGRVWRRVAETGYADGTLRFTHEAAGDEVRFAYFAPYSTERHLDLVARAAAAPGVTLRTLGRSIDGREIECLTLGDGPLSVWLFCRQHPGETMAEWWADGARATLTDPDHAIARALRRRATFHIVPNMNPDGSARGHLRTNAVGANLNREWHAPTDARSPEVKAVLAAMDETGVDFAIDAHGDEAIPHVFLAGFEGIPSLNDAQTRLYHAYRDALVRRTPDFQAKHGYESSRPGKANLAMATNQLAERYGAVSMTLEMPFKDNDDLPDAEYGWSPGRSMRLAEACLAALHDVVDELDQLRAS